MVPMGIWDVSPPLPRYTHIWNTKLRPFTCWDPIFSFAKLSAFFLRPRVRGAKNRRHSEREPVFLLAGFLNASKMVNVERITWKWSCLDLFFSGIHGLWMVIRCGNLTSCTTMYESQKYTWMIHHPPTLFLLLLLNQMLLGQFVCWFQSMITLAGASGTSFWVTSSHKAIIEAT